MKKFRRNWRAVYRKRGIDVLTSAAVSKVEKTKAGVAVEVRSGRQRRSDWKPTKF